MKLRAAFESQPKWLIVAEMTGLLGIIGFLDFMTSWGLSLFVFYGVPIFVGAWQVNRRAGFGLAAVAGIVWFSSNLHDHPYKSGGAYFWATLNRVFYFAFVAAGGAAMRRQREEARSRVEAITIMRNLELEVVRSGEREQMRIGQDLHDGVCQNLAAIDCATECLKEELKAEGLPQAAMAGKIQEFLKQTIVEARNLARGIFPTQVESDGLAAALNDLATKAGSISGGAVNFETSEEVRVEDPQVAMHFYRIAQEAINNATRHAGATRISMKLLQEGTQLELMISDNGRGFRPAVNRAEGIGLRTMRYRAQLIGAALAIRSEPGEGTVVECALHLAVSDSSPSLVATSS